MPLHTIGMWMYHNGGGAAIANQIALALKERSIHTIDNLNLGHALAQNGSMMCHGVEMEALDLYFSYNAGQQSSYQVYLYQLLDQSVPCINSYDAFALSEDKFKTAHLLNRHGIRTADYQLCRYDNILSVKNKLAEWGGKAVYKPTDGWGGQGIIKIESEIALDGLLPLLNEYNDDHFYIERFVDTDKTDFRIDVVDGEVVGCYGRKAPPNEWKTNVTSGGSVIMREANDELAELAVKVAQLTGLDIAGVDIIYDREREEYVVLEVNGIPAFATPEQEKLGIDFNERKIERIVNLIERKVKGAQDASAFAQKVA